MSRECKTQQISLTAGQSQSDAGQKLCTECGHWRLQLVLMLPQNGFSAGDMLTTIQQRAPLFTPHYCRQTRLYCTSMWEDPHCHLVSHMNFHNLTPTLTFNLILTWTLKPNLNLPDWTKCPHNSVIEDKWVHTTTVHTNMYTNTHLVF